MLLVSEAIISNKGETIFKCKYILTVSQRI